jgi:hypothetical protein
MLLYCLFPTPCWNRYISFTIPCWLVYPFICTATSQLFFKHSS